MFDLQHTLNLIDEGALDEAVDALETVIAQMPAYTPAYVLLAQTYEAQARWAEALNAWQRARFFAPNSPAIRDGLMRALEYQDALEDQGAPEDHDAAPESDEEDEEAAGDSPFSPSEDSSPPAGSDLEEDETDVLFDAPHDEGASSAPAPTESEESAAEESAAEESAAEESAAEESAAEESAAEESAAEEDGGDTAHEPVSEAPPADPVVPSLLDVEEPAQETDAAPETTSEHAAPPETEETPEATEDDETGDEEPGPRDVTSSRAGGFPPSAQLRPSPLDELMRQLPDTDQPLPEDLQDLDRLIDELEGARIDPQPDMSDTPAPDLENDIDDMVSETLARIYISQNQYEEAARVYLRLASQEPDRAQEHLEKAAALRDQARDPDA